MSNKKLKGEFAMKKQEQTVLKTETNEMTDAQKEAIVYRSKLLNRYYESYEDMLRDEVEFKRQNEEKLKAQEEKKARAKEVEEAYANYLKVREEAFEQIAKAEKEWIELRDKFAQDYNGYHMTYTNVNGQKQITFEDIVNHFFNW